jgi:hypothetical protein
MKPVLVRVFLAIIVFVAAAFVATPATQANAQQQPVVVAVEPKLCTALLVGLHHVNSTTAALACGSLTASTNAWTVAGFLTQANGFDDAYYEGDPLTRVDLECTADTNDDGVLCNAGDIGVDDDLEVRAAIDVRDDGKLDGVRKLRPSDFAAIDLDSNQMHQFDGILTLLVFVDDDKAIRFKTDKGLLTTNLGLDPGKRTQFCAGLTDLAATFTDDDCNESGAMEDGMVALQLIPGATSTRGAGHASALQGGLFGDLDFTVVGELHEISFTPLKTLAMTGTASGDCTFSLSVSGVQKALANPNLALILVRALDSDGTEITSALLDWTVDDSDKATVFLGTTPTADLGAFGAGFPQAICGNKKTGTVKVTAKRAAQSDTLDPRAQDVRASIEITIGGPPASIELSASPASVVCDGVNTSKVTAVVKDADGNFVSDGNNVEFSAQVIGSVSPTGGRTSGGSVATVLTPLAGGRLGVPVVVTAGSLQSSILVDCTPSAVGVPAAPGPSGGAAADRTAGRISGPDTGSGPVGGRSARPPWSVAFALLAGGAALFVVGRLKSSER